MLTKASSSPFNSISSDSLSEPLTSISSAEIPCCFSHSRNKAARTLSFGAPTRLPFNVVKSSDLMAVLPAAT